MGNNKKQSKHLSRIRIHKKSNEVRTPVENIDIAKSGLVDHRSLLSVSPSNVYGNDINQDVNTSIVTSVPVSVAGVSSKSSVLRDNNPDCSTSSNNFTPIAHSSRDPTYLSLGLGASSSRLVDLAYNSRTPHTQTPSSQPSASTPCDHTPARLCPPSTPRPSSASAPEQTVTETNTARKLKFLDKHSLSSPPSIEAEEDGGDYGNVLVNLNSFSDFMTGFGCPKCGNTGVLKTSIGKKMGLSLRVDVSCEMCEEVVKEWWTSKKKGEGKKKYNAVNRNSVYGSLSCGIGATRLRHLSQNLDMTVMTHTTFQHHAAAIYRMSPEVRKLVFARTVEIVRLEHGIARGYPVGEDEVINIAVSYDGSWLTRGYSSNIGIGCVIDMLTGEYNL